MSAGAFAFLFDLLYRLLELIFGRKLSQDVTPAYELSPHIKLREGGPLLKLVDALPHFLIRKDVKRLKGLLYRLQHAYHLLAESTARLCRCACMQAVWGVEHQHWHGALRRGCVAGCKQTLTHKWPGNRRLAVH